MKYPKNHKSWTQSGNVMLALFAAIGMVGVVGATSMGVMKGPVRGMHNVTQKTIAENNMIASGKLAVMAASNQAASGDCDADNTVEPLPWVATAGAKPAGGGLLPSSIGASLQDPWGNTYGYCAWDHGAAIQTTCATPTLRLAGTNVPAANAKPVIAIVSSGPDRIFQTTCINHHATNPYVSKTVGSDDIILAYSYAEAQSLSAGLWNLQTTDLNTAEIKKNLQVKNASNAVVFGVDSTTDISKPSIKVDYIRALNNSRIEMLSPLTVPTDISISENSATGARLRIVNPGKTGATTSDWSIWNMNTPTYNTGLAFWRYYANGTNAGTSLFLHDNGSVGINNSTTTPSQTLDVNGSMASTIMYDKNDGAYYVDPNGTSRMNALHPNTISCMNGTCPPGGVARFTPNLHLNSGDGNAVIVNWDNGTTGTGQSLRVGNGASADAFYVRADGLVYAAQYRDINDGSYYIDPASTSLTNDFRANIFYDRQDTNYYADPNVTSMFNDLRANIFYDRNNTGFYMQPSQTSNFNVLRVNNNNGQPSIIATQGGSQNHGTVMELAANGSGTDGPRLNFHKHGVKQWSAGIGHGGGGNGRFVIAENAGSGGWGTERFRIEGDYQSMIGTGPTRFWRDTDHNSTFAMHFNSNVMYFLSGWGAGWDNSWNNHVMEIHSDNSLRLRLIYDLDDTGYYWNGNGTTSMNAVYAHGYYYHSDERMKKNIQSISAGEIDKLYKLRGVTFDWKETDAHDTGLIAQEVQKLFPELVSQTDEGIMGVKYGNLVGVMIEALKSQKERIAVLEQKIGGAQVQDAGAVGPDSPLQDALQTQEGSAPRVFVPNNPGPLPEMAKLDISKVPVISDKSYCKKPAVPVCLDEPQNSSYEKMKCSATVNAYVYESRIYSLCMKDTPEGAEFHSEYASQIEKLKQAGYKGHDIDLGNVTEMHASVLQTLQTSIDAEKTAEEGQAGPVVETLPSPPETLPQVVPQEISKEEQQAVETLPSWVLPVVIGNGLLTFLLVIVFVASGRGARRE